VLAQIGAVLTVVGVFGGLVTVGLGAIFTLRLFFSKEG
jgi:hypothetical protein